MPSVSPGLLTVVLFAALALPAPARADATLFLGVTPTPENRATRGFALGFGVLILGIEFEYASTVEDPGGGGPALRTGMGNLLVQTPGFTPVQLYATAGGGLYREQLGARTRTHVGMNTGGGVKVRLAGPLRVRLDYRTFRLQGDPQHKIYQRVYAGANLAF